MTASWNSVPGGEAAAKPPVNQALDSIMEMAVQLPALKKLGEDLGMSLDAGVGGVASLGQGGGRKG